VAKIDDLISQVKDESLRVDLAAAATELRRRKKFGLVFESHIPETVALAAQVGLRPGVQVRLRKEPTDQTNYTVDALKGARATISAGDQSESVKVSDLLVVKPFGEPIYPVLRQSDPPIVRSEDRPFHTIINGENYFALELLQFAYRGQVDVVYADPPFNGMQSTWAYNNKIVDSNDVWKNSLWASMMEKRLQLCKSLLKPDTGIAVIAIDEHEVAHLSMLLEDIFPSPTYLRQMVTAVINPKGTGKANLARVDEYLFFVIPNTGKSLVSIPEAPPPWHAGKQEEEGQTDELLDELGEDAEEEAEETDQHDESDDEPGAEEEGYPFPIEELPLWERRHARRRGGESSYRSQRPNQFYPLWIDVKDGVVVRAGSSPTVLSARPSFRKQGGLKPIWPIDSEGNERCWRFIPESMQLLIDAGRVILGRYNETQDTYTINYWVKSNTKKRPKTVWWEKRHDAGTHGTSLLHKLLGDRQVFNFPKSLYSVADSLNVILSDRKDALVVDPFGGSGTTIHALALMNAADEGRRRGILITNNEVDQKSAKELNEQGYGEFQRSSQRTGHDDRHHPSDEPLEASAWQVQH
jgi:adenine-specific DNA-methyltransferase